MMTKKRDEQVDAVPVSGARWVWGEKCEEEGLVNCRFKEAGACQTPRHEVKLADPVADLDLDPLAEGDYHEDRLPASWPPQGGLR